MTRNLTSSSPFRVRLSAYLAERFPPLTGLMFLILFTTCYVLTAYLTARDRPVVFRGQLVAGFIAVYLFFFRLRVFDEHKDYEKDCINHPQRMLQSGLITLRQLRTIAIGGIGVEAAVSWWFGPVVLYWWGVAFAYSLLMAKEFFVPRWLEPRLFLYALTHMAIMPLIVLWIAAMARPAGDLPASVSMLGLLSFFSGLAFEICRKIRAPVDEVPNIRTYSQIFGTRRAAINAFGCLIFSAGMLAYLLWQIRHSGPLQITVVVLTVLCGLLFVRFIQRPTSRHAKGLELGASLFMLAAYLLVMIVTLLKTGLQWQ